MWPSALPAAVAETEAARRTLGVPTSPADGPSEAPRRPNMAPEGPRAACPAGVEPTAAVAVAWASVRSTPPVVEEAVAPREGNSAA